MKSIHTIIMNLSLGGALLISQTGLSQDFPSQKAQLPAGPLVESQQGLAERVINGNPTPSSTYHQILSPTISAQAGHRYTQFGAYLNPIFQDSSVITAYASSSPNVFVMKAGGTLDPTSTRFTTPLPSGTAYTIDTVWIGGRYEMNTPNAGDTLYVELSWGTPVNPWFATLGVATTPPETFYTAKNTTSTLMGNTCHGTAPAANSALVKYVFSVADSFAVNHLAFKYYYAKPIGGPAMIPAGAIVGIQYTFVPKAAYSAGATYYSGKTGTHATMNNFSTVDVEDSAYTAGGQGNYYFYDASSKSCNAYLSETSRYGLYSGANAGLNGDMFGMNNDGWTWAMSVSATLPTSVNELHTYGISMGQNAPNPFSGLTTITYEIPNASDVVFTVHDISGRVVLENAYTNISAGTHTLNVNASDFSKGIYFYSIRANGQSLSKKMMITE